MHGVLTGDITDSRSVPTEEWIPVLKEVLKLYGREGKDWEIYRGDSFQLMIVPENALLAAYHIKACMKQFAKLDVRTAIGIGRVAHRATKVTQSNGDALVRSGEAFETLKKQHPDAYFYKSDTDMIVFSKAPIEVQKETVSKMAQKFEKLMPLIHRGSCMSN